MKRQGLPGILEIDPETNIIYFHADPNYRQPIANMPAVTISGLNHNDLQQFQNNTINLTINIEQPTRDHPLIIATPKQPITTIPTPNITNPPLPTTYPVPVNGFADILYPRNILLIYQAVLDGTWKGQHPENSIDDIITTWFNTNIGDTQQYLKDLIKALNHRKAHDLVFARLNAELITEPDTSNTITICRNRRFRLPYEGVSIPAVDELNADDDQETISIDELTTDQFIPPIDQSLLPTDHTGAPIYASIGAYEAAEKLAQTFYADQEVITKPPAPGLPQHIKNIIKDHLRAIGHNLIYDQNLIATQLEKNLRTRTTEDNILARLVYLLLLNNLIDNQDVKAILTTKQTSLQTTIPKRLKH